MKPSHIPFYLTIALHLALIALIIPWRQTNQHWQLSVQKPIIQAYVAHEVSIPSLQVSKVGLIHNQHLRAHPSKTDNIEHSRPHWPQLTQPQIKTILETLSRMLAQALEKENWQATLKQNITVQFLLMPNNQISQITFLKLNAHSALATKLKLMLLALPHLEVNIKHGPLTVELPIQIGQTTAAYNAMDNL